MALKTFNPIRKKRLIVKAKKPFPYLNKKKIKKRFKGNHHEILKHSLNLLIEDLLPLAVEEYSDNPKQGAAYAVTNIISEIRGTIQQLDAAVDAEKIRAAIINEVALALKMSITRMAGHVTLLKDGLPLKVRDSAIRRDMGLLLDDILKEYEANMTEVITNIEIRIANAIGGVIKGPKTQRRVRKKRKR